MATETKQIIIRQGLAVDRPTLVPGEPGLDTDTNQLWLLGIQYQQAHTYRGRPQADLRSILF